MALLPATFTVTDEHIKLLERLYIEWNDDYDYAGCPGANPKRPYGNSDVYGDVAEILGWDVEDEDDGLSEAQERVAKTIHEEMGVVLQILTQNPTAFTAGAYQNVDKFAPYGTTYRKIEQ